MFDTSLMPPSFDQATVDHYVAKGSRLRSRAFGDLFRGIFAAPDSNTGKVATSADCTA